MVSVKAMVDWGDIRDIEIRYNDPTYEVYSYADGDGIWGTGFSDWEEFVNFLKKIGQYDEKKIEAFSEDLEPFEIEVPDTHIGYSVLKKGKLVSSPLKELQACADGVEGPDGQFLEPDAEENPLRQMGMI